MQFNFFTPCLPTLFCSAMPQAAAMPQESQAMQWEEVAPRLEELAQSGFSGVAWIVRDSEVFLKQAYGLANREEQIAVTSETVFAIGSTPIDFTKAAILRLHELDMLGLDEKLPAFFEDVPEDKQAITIEHLMSGRSGLRDFHDLPGDEDPDHSWIDRAEAVARIFAQELLFPPGQGREHSHSAWGLLAAIVELRSEQSYQEFTREHLFGPAGMASTGFFGEPVVKERLAIGYGMRQDGKINAPPYWGPTSWLVMGSGGMVSTAGDIERWLLALHGGKILSPESLTRYFSPKGSVLAGGDMYGFEIVYTEGPETYMILLGNSFTRETRPKFHAFTEALASLVLLHPSKR